MTINAVSRCVRVPRNVDGKLYGTANLGTCGGGTVTRNPAGGTPALNWSAASLADGETLTITTDGTYNFGTKSAAAPLLFERFDGYTPGQILQNENANWNQYESYGGGLVSDADCHSGLVSIRGDLTRNGFGTNWYEFAPTTEVYCSYWMKLANVEGNETGGGAVLKFVRIGSTAAQGGGGPYNGAGIHALTSHSPATLSSGKIGNGYIAFTSNTFSGPLAYIDAPVNQWTRVEMWIRLSTAGVADGRFHCRFVNGASSAQNNITNRASGQTHKLNTVLLGVMHANFTAGAMEIYNDDVWVDNTPRRVEIGNNATYDNCTVREPQPATAWSASSITVSLNLTGLSNDKWLFVIDGDNAVVGSVALQ